MRPRCDTWGESAQTRAGNTRAQTPALLKGLLVGPTGHAMVPTHTRRRGRLYPFYVSTAVLKRGREACPVRRVPRHARVDSTLVKALACAQRWQRMLEEGTYASVAELAAAERINASYLARVLRLTLLAPDIVEVAVNEQHNSGKSTLGRLMRLFSPLWKNQHDSLQLAALRRPPP